MTKNILLAVILLISTLAYGQNFENNFTFSSFATYDSYNYNPKASFGLSTSLQKFYNFNDHFSIGTELKYAYENFKTNNNNFWEIEHDLSAHSISIPLMLRFKTTSDWSFIAGLGLSYNFRIDNTVTYNGTDWETGEVLVVELNSAVEIKDGLNYYYSIELGKTFAVKGKRIMTSLYYQRSIVDYNIRHGALFAEILLHTKIKPQHFGIKIGYEL